MLRFYNYISMGSPLLRGPPLFVLKGLGLLTCQEMLLELVRAVELYLAPFALEKLQVQMSALVVFLIALRDEPLIAELALEWLVTRVGPCVQDHQAFMLKCLVAALVWAPDLLLGAEPAALLLEVEVLLELLQLLARLGGLVLAFLPNVVQGLVNLLHLVYWQIDRAFRNTI